MKSKKKLNPFIIPIYITIIVSALLCVLPMLLVVMVSFTDEASLARTGYTFFPEVLSLDAYRTLFGRNTTIWRSFFVSTFVTSFGTFLATLTTGMAAYTLVNRRVTCRNGLALFFLITMIFNAGMVPWFMMSRALGMVNNVWALIIPGLVFSPFNLFLTRNYMRGIPEAMMDAALIDGANDFSIAFRIYFPLSKPVLATIALFYGITYWNDWFNSIMLINDRRLHTMQFFLYSIQSEITMIANMAAGIVTRQPPLETFRMATAVVTIIPIIMLYPFLQRYFVKGLVIGGVKE